MALSTRVYYIFSGNVGGADRDCLAMGVCRATRRSEEKQLVTGMKGTYQSNSSESQSTRKVTAISKLLQPGWNAFSDQRDRNEVCGNRERKTCPVLVVRHGENFLSFGNCARPCLICPLFFSRPGFQRRTSIRHEKTKGRRRNKSKGRNIKARLFSALYKPDTRRLLALCNFTRCVRSYRLTQRFPSRGNLPPRRSPILESGAPKSCSWWNRRTFYCLRS